MHYTVHSDTLYNGSLSHHMGWKQTHHSHRPQIQERTELHETTRLGCVAHAQAFSNLPLALAPVITFARLLKLFKPAIKVSMSYDHLRDQGRNPLAFFYGQQGTGSVQEQELPQTNRALCQQNVKFDPDEDPTHVSVAHLNVSILYCFL